MGTLSAHLSESRSHSSGFGAWTQVLSLHQVGEEFLNSEVASKVPALLSTRRICGTGGIRGGTQRTSSASLIRDRSRPPSTTITPLGSVSRGDGNVGRRSVCSGFPDGVSDDRSSPKATSFSSLLCFPFGCPFGGVVRQLRCVQDRGSRERNLKPSVFGNPFEVAENPGVLGPYDVTRPCSARTTIC